MVQGEVGTDLAGMLLDLDIRSWAGRIGVRTEVGVEKLRAVSHCYSIDPVDDTLLRDHLLPQVVEGIETPLDRGEVDNHQCGLGKTYLTDR